MSDPKNKTTQTPKQVPTQDTAIARDVGLIKGHRTLQEVTNTRPAPANPAKDSGGKDQKK